MTQAEAAQYLRITDRISRIERIITDNHLNYRRSAEVAAVVDRLGARYLFIEPHRPWQNGKVERFNRTLQTEWAYRRVFTSNTERAHALALWPMVRRGRC